MLNYVIGKVFYGLLVLFGVVSLIFLLFNVIPGDPVRMMMGQRTDAESIKAIERDLGRDLPLSSQYIKFINDLSPLSIHVTDNGKSYLYYDKAIYGGIKILNLNGFVAVLKLPYLRRSYQSKENVSAILSRALPATLILAVSAIVFAFFIGIALGIIAAIRQNSFIDRSLLTLATIGMSGPSFFIALIMSWLFGYVWADRTGLNMTGSLYEIDDFGRGEFIHLSNLILPAFTLGIRPLSVVMQLMRNSILDVLDRDFIRTARAKGLSEWRVLGKHALRNSLNPVITAVSGWFAGMLAGAVFVEMIFAWKGIGWEIVNALEHYDFPVVMGSVIVISALFVLINMAVDIVYTILDPRVKLNGR